MSSGRFRREASSVPESRRFRSVARLAALDRLIVVRGDFALDLDLFAFDQAGRFVGLF